MALEYYRRKGDLLCPVYEIDTVANTWALAGSMVGRVAGLGGTMGDGGAIFRDPEKFERVWKKAEAGDVVTFTCDAPEIL